MNLFVWRTSAQSGFCSFVIKKKEVTRKIFDSLAVRYRDRRGGYIRVVKTGRRIGDGAPLSVVELIPEDAGKAVTKKKTRKPKTVAQEGEKKEAVKKG